MIYNHERDSSRTQMRLIGCRKPLTHVGPQTSRATRTVLDLTEQPTGAGAVQRAVCAPTHKQVHEVGISLGKQVGGDRCSQAVLDGLQKGCLQRRRCRLKPHRTTACRSIQKKTL